MLVQWYANFEAEEEKVAPRLDELVRKAAQASNAKVLGGPYHPQNADVLYLMEYNNADDFQKAGKWLLTEAAKSGVAIAPMKYDIAFKCGEAGGP